MIKLNLLQAQDPKITGIESNLDRGMLRDTT